MKKVYSFLFLLLSCLCLPVQANKVVTELGDPVTDLSKIKVGDQLVLFCNGPVDPADKEYGMRMAYLCEGDENSLWLSRDFREGDLKTADFLWTVLSYTADSEYPNTYKSQLQSPRGNNLPAFTANETRPKFTCTTVAPADGDAEFYTVTMANAGDSLY